MNNTDKQYKNLNIALPVAELLIIKRDIDLLAKIMREAQKVNPVFMMQFLPYISMTCYEAIEYINKNSAEVEIANTSKYSIKDIRNKAKFFDLRFNKILQSTKNVDELQHSYFAKIMKYPELVKWNIHDNLGIYFNSDKKVLGNTQYQVWVFQDENTIKKPLNSMDGFEIQSDEIKAFGYDLGRITVSLSEGLSSVNDFITSDISFQKIKIHANDFNTNRCMTDGIENYKTVHLLLLHILSSIGFILYVLKKCVVRENGLLLRIEYIMLHYGLKSIEAIKGFLKADRDGDDNKKLLKCISGFEFNNNTLLDIEFGKCMRHYGLRNKDGKPMVEGEKFDLALPLCGLVESRYNKSYMEYQIAIEAELKIIYNKLYDYMGFENLLSVNRDILA